MITEEWVVVWFPPSGDKKKVFKTEASARLFVVREPDWERHLERVADWNPILLHRVTEVTETVLELTPKEPSDV